jgi:hypothetical protein
MSPIERWGMSECPDCGVLTCATAEQVQWCDDHCRSNPTVVEVVRADAHRGAVEACLAQWVIAHDIKCGCENPDTAGCDWPVPIPHTQAALDTALGGRR